MWQYLMSSPGRRLDAAGVTLIPIHGTRNLRGLWIRSSPLG